MPLRKHQKAVENICSEIRNGDPILRVYLDCHPGSGKSGDSILFAKHLIGHGYDKICHVAPRLSLCYQIEEGMLDPFFNSGKTIRVADNGPDPSRGLDGFSITFQAICSNVQNLINDFKKHRYILVLDEAHHQDDGGSWEKPVAELVKLAKLSVFMSGTSFRHDGKPLSFFDYKDGQIDRTETKNKRFITYTRRDALEENAIIPVRLNMVDGAGSYIKGNKQIEYDSLKREHVRAAVSSQYAYDIIDADMPEFLDYKSKNPWAQMIVVGPDIEISRDFAKHISEKWCKCQAVDSKMPNAVEVIKKFKQAEFPVLSSVNIAAEGLDVPNVCWMIVLTNIRSEPFLVQCINRATRFKPYKDWAFITAPADEAFQQFFKNWLWEQERVLEEKEERKGGGSGGGQKPEFEVLHGEAHIPPSEKEHNVRQELNHLINSYVGKQSVKQIGSETAYIHTESMRRRKLLWMKIYICIGRKCKLKEMTYDEMLKAKALIESITEAKPLEAVDVL